MGRGGDRVVVTRHAWLRWRARGQKLTGLKDLDLIARSAWVRGEKHDRVHNGTRMTYLGMTFVFKPEPEAVVLVTVIDPIEEKRPR